MAILRFKHTDTKPADGQAVQLVNIDGLSTESGGSSITDARAETLEPGESATAGISGTTLVLGIPKGATGDAGPTGATGVGVASISLTVADGAVTAGTWTDTDSVSHTIEIT